MFLILWLFPVIFSGQICEYVVGRNLEAVLYGDVVTSCVPLVLADVVIMRVSSGNIAVIRGNCLVQGFYIAVLEKGGKCDGLENRSWLANLGDCEVESLLERLSGEGGISLEVDHSPDCTCLHVHYDGAGSADPEVFRNLVP